MSEVLCLFYRLRNLELRHHANLVIHLDATLNQLHLRAFEVREVELVDLKLLGVHQLFFLEKQNEL